MKKLMLAFCFLFGGLVAVNAQDTTSTSTQTQQYPTSTSQDDQDRERINSRDLPDAVKRSLEGTEYRGWLVNAAYKSTGVSDQATSGQMGSDSTSVGSQGTQSTQGAQGDQTMQTDSTSTSGNTGNTTSTSGSTSGSTGNNSTMGSSGNTGAYGQEVYVVELKNGAQTKTVRFNKDGSKLDDEGSGNNDQK
jgi:hypothetical protein